MLGYLIAVAFIMVLLWACCALAGRSDDAAMQASTQLMQWIEACAATDAVLTAQQIVDARDGAIDR